MTEQLQRIKNENGGKFPAFSWPGGYPIYYLDGENNVLCADCATKEDEYSSPTVAYDIHYEGESLFCDDCNAEIESAYGVPE